MALNKQGPGKIEWTDWTYNPISGCKHGCSYCYLKKMDKRFKSNLMKPAYHPDRINDLDNKKLKPGDKIFVGSSGDMFGEWVNKLDIMVVLSMINNFPNLIFQFLTKNPVRYAKFNFNDNCWAGTTIDNNARAKSYRELRFTSKNFFISFEPLLEEPNCDTLNFILLTSPKWIIIGGETGGNKKPDEWANKIINLARDIKIPVFIKSNYQYHKIIKEFPNFE